MNHTGIEEIEKIVRRDPRYDYRAYEFVFEALRHTVLKTGRKQPHDPKKVEPHHHVSGRELLEGARDLALREFGLMARTVFHVWGINRTDDFGEIVFNLVDAGLMSKTERDTREEFRGVFDLDEALVKNYRIRMEDGDSA